MSVAAGKRSWALEEEAAGYSWFLAASLKARCQLRSLKRVGSTVGADNELTIVGDDPIPKAIAGGNGTNFLKVVAVQYVNTAGYGGWYVNQIMPRIDNRMAVHRTQSHPFDSLPCFEVPYIQAPHIGQVEAVTLWVHSQFNDAPNTLVFLEELMVLQSEPECRV